MESIRKTTSTRAAARSKPKTSIRAIHVTSATSRWGWLPLIGLVDAVALVLAALAYTAHRYNVEWSPLLLWMSLLAIYMPIAWRLASVSAARRERIGLVILLGIAFYMIKVLHSPVDFTFHDEFLHWNTANHILDSNRLFTSNSLLPVSPLYPGLEIVTAAFADLSGISVVHSGVIILGLGRIAFMLALYLFYERISASERIAGIATLLYTANSNFLFFDSQFSYESLSLPIAVTVLFWASYVAKAPTRVFIRHLFLIFPLIFTVAMTHHLTGYALGGFLMLWAVIALIRNRFAVTWLHVGLIAVMMFISISRWSTFVGNKTADYLGPVFRSGFMELYSLIIGENTGRQLFQGATGQSSPIWERIVGLGSVALILVVLPFGIFQIIQYPFHLRIFGERIRVLRFNLLQSWHRYRKNAATYAMALIVFLHPIMLSFRFTSSGWEIANRSSEFLFWAIAFILAVGSVSLQSFDFKPYIQIARKRVLNRWFSPTFATQLPPRLGFLRRVPAWQTGFVVWATVIYLGGTISGWPPWARLPGSYLVSADTRSIEAQGIAATKWVGEYLEPNSHISADRTNTLMLGVYGHQRPITHLADDTYLASVFFSPHFGPSELELIERVDLEYLLADTRITTQLPLVGVYFEGGEPSLGENVRMPLAALEKFDAVPNMSRIFDDGSIRIYDVRGLYDIP